MKLEELGKEAAYLNSLRHDDLVDLIIGRQLIRENVKYQFKETCLVEDLKDSLDNNADIRLSKMLLNRLDKMKTGTLVLVTKEIHRGTIIYEIDVMTEKFIKKNL